MRLRWSSFRCAFAGLYLLLKTQRHARWHLLATLLITDLGFYEHLSRLEWAALILAMGSVWTAEALNSAIEFLGDAITKEQHPLIGAAKDIAAGGVLIAAFVAFIIGLLIFVPHFTTP